MIDIVVGHSLRSVALWITLSDGLVVVVRVLRDDVPGVEDAWEHAEHAQSDVDDRVGGADPDLDPYWKGRDNVSARLDDRRRGKSGTAHQQEAGRGSR